MGANKFKRFHQRRSGSDPSCSISVKRRNALGGFVLAIFLGCTVFGYTTAESKTGGDPDEELTDIELLGKHIFFDKISVPKRMSCATCHDPSAGWTFGVSGVNLHEVAITGADPHTAGSVKPPSNAYASFIKPFFDASEGCLDGVPRLCGGVFWNGRSEGRPDPVFPPGATEHVGDEVFEDANGILISALKDEYEGYLGPVADQALNPFPNPVEQNIERAGVCGHVESARYAELFDLVWLEPIDCSSAAGIDKSFKRITVALSAWQASKQVNSFSSKRDAALRNDADGNFPLDDFTPQENLGHDLFYNRRPNPFAPAVGDNQPPFPHLPVTNCSFCHSDDPRHDTGAEEFQLYSDTAYHNIGVPRNPEIPDSGKDPDEGLAGHTGIPAHLGFFKTPLLRNVDKRPGKGFIKAYTHNGFFKSLESIVHFYNTALIGGATANSFGVTRCPTSVTTEKDALKQNCWPAPAKSGSAIGVLVGNLELTREQEAAIVAYLKTLTDTNTPKPPRPYK